MIIKFCIFIAVCVLFVCVASLVPAVQDLSSAKADVMRIEAVDKQAADQLQRQKDLIEWSEARAKEKDIDTKVAKSILPGTSIPFGPD
jgi:hypothetical protein